MMSENLVNPTTEEEEVDNPIEDCSNAVTKSVEDNQICNVAALLEFWPKVMEDIRNIEKIEPKSPVLPLARIKKVMKLDDDVKMISSEVPVLFSKAVEIFIKELTLRGWIHTEGYQRRTLLRNDVGMAISKYDQYDFLVDIVPREEVKSVTKVVSDTTLNPDQVQYPFHSGQQQQQTHNASTSNTGQTIQILQPIANQVVTLQNGTQDPVVNIENDSNNTSNISTSTLNTVSGSQGSQIIQLQSNTQPLNTNASGVLQLVQQVITPRGIPIQLNANQMLMLRPQVQNSPQTQQVQLAQSQPKIIQVASQTNGPRTFYILSQPAKNPSTSPE